MWSRCSVFLWNRSQDRIRFTPPPHLPGVLCSTKHHFHLWPSCRGSLCLTRLQCRCTNMCKEDLEGHDEYEYEKSEYLTFKHEDRPNLEYGWICWWLIICLSWATKDNGKRHCHCHCTQSNILDGSKQCLTLRLLQARIALSLQRETYGGIMPKNCCRNQVSQDYFRPKLRTCTTFLNSLELPIGTHAVRLLHC